MILIGIGRNNWSQGVPDKFEETCEELKLNWRRLDLNVLADCDLEGVTHLTPTLLIFQETASNLFRRAEERGVKVLNQVLSIEMADDKVSTFKRLLGQSIPQITTDIIPLEIEAMRNCLARFGNAVVFKMPHGGQGRWVRLAKSDSDIKNIFDEFLRERVVPIVAQPFIEEAQGKSLRLIVLNGRVTASSLRMGTSDWRSNIALGGTQVKYDPTNEEKKIAILASKSLGLKFAGVDLIHTRNGTKVIEVNACPDFTSMETIGYKVIAEEIISELITSKSPQEHSLP